MTLRQSLICKCFPAHPSTTTTETWTAESVHFGPLHLDPGRHFAKDAKDDVENLYSILGLQKGKTLRLQAVKLSTAFKLLNRVDQLQGASPEEIKAAYKRLAKDRIFRVPCHAPATPDGNTPYLLIISFYLMSAELSPIQPYIMQFSA